MLRWVVGTVICMNICSDHSVQARYQLSSMYEDKDVPFEHALDGLSDIVCEMKRTRPGKDDIDFDNQVIAVISAAQARG
jgi:hypothetical protein